eukprot:GHVS01004721.1.p1 GENE.GHVS01004721.1~~GHVS01004721.1.p1  ORF type:complete len:452 (+),score=113.75 GHVS01004721.1:390-1745(+)
MHCPDHYKLDRQSGKCIRVIEREPIPFCPEGFTLEKSAKVSQKGGGGGAGGIAVVDHQKSGVFQVDNVCYRLNISPPKWNCPPNGTLAIDPAAGTTAVANQRGGGRHDHQPLRAGNQNKQEAPPKDSSPTCGVTERLQPLRLCPPGSEASQDGQCIVRQTIQMRFECPDGYRIDPLRRQCFKHNVIPLARSCKRGELQSGRCVEVEVAPPRMKCPSLTQPDRDNKTCVKRNYAPPVFSCGKKGGGGQLKQGSGGEGAACRRTVEVRVKFGCGEEEEEAAASSGGGGGMKGKKKDSGATTTVQPKNGKCLREHARRPDVRCAEGSRMGFGGNCVKVETEEAEFDCPRGYRFIPARDRRSARCVATTSVGGEGGGSGGSGEEEEGEHTGGGGEDSLSGNFFPNPFAPPAGGRDDAAQSLSDDVNPFGPEVDVWDDVSSGGGWPREEQSRRRRH